jgi:hypothetical protein
MCEEMLECVADTVKATPLASHYRSPILLIFTEPGVSCPPSITAIHSPSPPHHSTSSQLSPTSKRRVHYHIDASGKHLIVRDLASCRQIHFSPFFAMNSTVTTILVDSSSLVSYSPFPHISEELHSVTQLTNHLFVLSGSGTVIGAAVRRCFEGRCRQHCRSRPCLLFIQY